MKTSIKTDVNMRRILRGISDLTLPKAEWTHEAHFAAAIVMLSEIGDAAFTQMPPTIRAYNEATGVPNTDTVGYHETITLASLMAARHVMGIGPNLLNGHLGNLMASEFGTSDWLLSYWSRELLFSPESRKNWTPSDKAPLPFNMSELAQ